MTRFEIIQPENMSAEQREVAEAITSGPRGALKGPFLALIHNPALASKVQALGEHLRYDTGLPQQLVEIAILVTARRWSCDYEWAAHARIAREAGLREDIMAPLSRNVRPDGMDKRESIVHDFAHETVWAGQPTDKSYDAFVAELGKATALDVLAVCGYYSLLAFVLNTAEFPLPAGATALGDLADRVD